MEIRCATEDEWLAERRKSIGGSDAPAILGCEKAYNQPFRVALEKMGKAPPQPPSDSLFWGHLIEDDIREAYTVKSGRAVDYPGPRVIIRSDDNPWAHMSPDGFVNTPGRGRGVFQAKHTRYGSGAVVEGAPLRLAYEVQVQHEMMVTGCRWASVAVLHVEQGFQFQWFDVERNDEFCALLMRKEKKFWDDVQEGILPEVDGSASTEAAVRYLHPNDNGKSITLGTEHALSFEEWEAWGMKKDDADERHRKAKTALMQAIGEHTFAVLPNGVRLSWRTQKNGVRVLRREK